MTQRKISRQRAYQIRQSAIGNCPRCGQPVAKGYKQCKGCLAWERAYKYRRKHAND